MADRLYSLRHDTIVCCYYKDCDICGVCSTHTHGSKCLMSRCIKEGDLLAVDVNYISTDVLCDSAGLASCYICLTDCIQKGGFTMVNMTHNADYRRSGNHCGLIFLFLFQKLLDNVYLLLFLCNNIKSKSDLLCLLEIDLMVYSYHLAFHKQLLHDCRWLHLHSLSKLADGKLLRNCDLLDLRLLLFLLWLRSWLLKGFRNSGHLISSALVRSVSAA
ncbi:conserved domain protein [Ruminococcus sp. CAG:60]|nr:conserved domain protein [Ruminococcus sp. CAG:60]